MKHLSKYYWYSVELGQSRQQQTLHRNRKDILTLHKSKLPAKNRVTLQLPLARQNVNKNNTNNSGNRICF